MTNPIQIFLSKIEQHLKSGVATEHTYRPALQSLFNSLLAPATATNEPKHAKYGAPDFVIQLGNTPIGHIEAKDVGVDLEKFMADSEKEQPSTDNGKQLKRYRSALPNLLYTDGLTWYWFVSGKPRLEAPIQLAAWDKRKKKLTVDQSAKSDLTQLLTQFKNQKVSTVNTPAELAQRLAQIARWLCEVIAKVFDEQDDHGELHEQLEAFRKTLLPSLKPPEFADMYAQTIVYGMFAARVSGPEKETFTRIDAASAIPKTNPFLRRLFQEIAGYDLDERIVWLVDDCARLLQSTDMAAVLQDFGRATRREDPVFHFYETFLTAYDPDLREKRGVYYTPEPVVSYIVRSVDAILRKNFKKSLGLADDQTIILDPAVGTATFLHAVVQHIHQSLVDQGLAGSWNSYVPQKLLPRIFGFELLMAPYTVGHLKMGLLLKELGYNFASNERLGIYLTNTLADAPTGQQALAFAQYIATEGQAANQVKHEKPVMVVLGNPPYYGFSANQGVWIDKLMEDYKITVRTEERQIQRLSNDYVKFIRFAQWRLEQSGKGVLAFITDNGYLTGILSRDMRKSLLDTFSEIYIFNLHGMAVRGSSDKMKGDQNVFDITQGVAIALFVKHVNALGTDSIHYAEVRGDRESKYKLLSEQELETTDWQQVTPQSPYWFFAPFSPNENYDSWDSFINIIGTGVPKKDRDYRYGTGIKTRHDPFVIGWSPDDAIARVKQIADRTETDQDLIEKLDLCTTSHFDIKKARLRAKDNGLINYVRPIAYRPFDQRYVVYLREFICEPKAETMQHVLQGDNITLAVLRKDRKELMTGYLAANGLVAKDYVSNLDDAVVWPLYLYATPQEVASGLYDATDRRPNISPTFISKVEQRLNMRFLADGRGDRVETIGPEDIFDYIYAVFHSPTYRASYAELLKIDFPRVPIVSDKAVFAALVDKGAELVDLHLLRLPGENGVGGKGGAVILSNPGKQGISFPKAGSGMVEKTEYVAPANGQPGRVHINNVQCFEGIDKPVWDMHIGSYRPLEKWLKDRKGRVLAFEDIQHYLRIVISLRETIRVMDEINECIMSF